MFSILLISFFLFGSSSTKAPALIKFSNVFLLTTLGFTLFAKKHQADIVPVAVCGFDGYAHKLFEKHMTIKVGKPISYTLPDDEIVREWARQICELTGFENKVEEHLEKENVTIS